MAGWNARKDGMPRRLRRWLEGGRDQMRGARERVGCSGCAVGLLGTVVSGYCAVALVDGLYVLLTNSPVEAERYYGVTLSGLWRFPLAALLSLVPFAICWRYPSLSEVVFWAVAALFVGLVFLCAMGVIAGMAPHIIDSVGQTPAAERVPGRRALCYVPSPSPRARVMPRKTRSGTCQVPAGGRAGRTSGASVPVQTTGADPQPGCSR
jgi:hypothetical protein